MGWPSMQTRKEWIVKYPLRMGFAWAALSTLLVAMVQLATRGAFEGITLGTMLVLFTVFAPAWGYSTRWFLMRGRRHAG